MPISMKMPDSNNKKRIVQASGGDTVKTPDYTEQMSKYAKSQTVSYPITKAAQYTGSISNTVFGQPMFFSPLHTPQSWQTASKRREVYQWSFIPSNGCKITLYDGSVAEIDQLYNQTISDPNSSYMSPFALLNKINQTVANGDFDNSDTDLISKNNVTKKAVKLSVRGVFEDINITFDHNCLVIKEKDIKCKYHETKNCTDTNGSVCKKRKCNGFNEKNIKEITQSIKADNIEKGDYLLVPFPTKVEKCDIDSNSKAKFIGYLAADGSISHDKKNIRICINDKDMPYINDTLDEVFLEYQGYKANCVNTSTIQEKRSSSTGVFNFCKQFVKGKGVEKKFTEKVLYLDTELQKHLLGAYIDADGDCSLYHNNINITTYSPHLANQLLLMLYRCGILASGTKQPISSSSKTFDTKNEFRYIISIPSSETFKIKDYISFKSDSIKEKKNNGKKRFFWNNHVVTPVTKVEYYDYSGPVYDIQAPPEHTIIVNGVAIYQCRFYYSNEPKVAAGVDYYSEFPMNGFKLECEDQDILEYYNDLVETLSLNDWLSYISHEYFLLGDVFPFLEISCPVCGGSGMTPEGETCNHPGGTFKRIVLLNPDYISVQRDMLTNDEQISLTPDEELKNIIERQDPIEIFESIPPRIRDMIISGRPIILSPRSVSHIKHNASPYGSYGTPLMRRLFTILAYKTKLMTANWIVAERMILPVRVVKLGSEQRPASEDEIMDVVNQLAAVSNDPNLTLVTHHAFDYEWFGACYDDETRVLTNKGIMDYKDIIHEDINGNKVINDDIEIMVFDSKSGTMRYEKPNAFHEYDYNGIMHRFSGNKVDICVTPNHRMLGYKRDKHTAYVMKSQDFMGRISEYDRYIRACAEYKCDDTIENITIGDTNIDLNVFLRFAGYYLSEGYSTFNEDKRQYICSVSQSPTKNGNKCLELDDIFESLNIKYSKYEYKDKATAWDILCKDFVFDIKQMFGKNSYDKKIPEFIKNLPSDKLMILIDAFCKGDASYYNYSNSTAVQISTVSKQLSEDLFEIMFKAGLSPVFSESTKKNKSGSESYMVYCNLTENGKGRFSRVKDKHCSVEEYNGKVWCFETSTGFFVTVRNGRIAIQGNTGKIHNITAELEEVGKEILDGFMLNQALLNGEMAGYSSSAVGVESLIRRLDSWRNKLSDWVRKHIFLPVAMMQGFIDSEKTKKLKKSCYIYPNIVWNNMNLRDRTSELQSYMQLYDKQIMSAQTLCEKFDLNYDQEVERLRQEQLQVGPMGQAPGMGGMDMGGLGGGMDMGGLGGGMDMGGLGGDMDMGGLGGDMGAPGMDMGAPGMDMGGGMGAAPTAAQSGLKITKGGNKSQNEQQQPKMTKIKLTSLENSMYRMLESMQIPYPLFVQFQVPISGNSQPYVLDFAYPSIGVGIETDGDIFHTNAESIQRDMIRDKKLANIGWRILRFTEKGVHNEPDAIKSIIVKHIKDAVEQKKKASSDEGFIKFAQNSKKEIVNYYDYLSDNNDKLKYHESDLENNLGSIIYIGA